MNNTIDIQVKENQLSAQKILDTIPGNIFIYDILTEKLIYTRSISDEHLTLTTEELINYGSDIGGQFLHPGNKIAVGWFLEELNNLSEVVHLRN